MLEAAYEVGLSGGGRLHDLFVSHEAMTPGDYKRRGEGLAMAYGFHPSPFGDALLIVTERGLAGLAFVDEDKAQAREDVLSDMMERWPKARFANVVLWNRYLQTFDYRYRRVSLNRRQMRLEADGSYRIVIAHRDPGLPNWLDTEQRASGTIYWRFLMPEGELEQPRTKLLHRGRPILMLRSLVLALDDDSCRKVRHSHRGLRPVHVLSARPARAVYVDPEILRSDVDLDLVIDLWINKDRCKRGMTPRRGIER